MAPVPIRRVTANNPGPFTLAGTNAYVIGEGRVAIIDPGPDDPAQLDALTAALDGATVSHILVTHTHRDHSGGVAALKAATGALTVGGGRHRWADGPAGGGLVDASADRLFVPDITLGDGDRLAGDGWTIEAIATPGHTANHLVYALSDTDIAFSGDHVMGWSTTIVAPPDGNMADYRASLEKLLKRNERRYLPGHGEPIEDAPARLHDLRDHRTKREVAILERLRSGDRTIPEMVATIYADIDPSLHAAAGLSVLAHLRDLIRRGLARSDAGGGIDDRFRPA